MSDLRFGGLGAQVHDGGTSFGVWAPHAQAVHVVGDFNDWDESATPMTRDGDVWRADVQGAKVGQEYKYAITAENGTTLQRIDPYARQTTNSVGNAIIYDDDQFDWGDDEFTCPPMNELVIYELHVGSFAPATEDSVGRLAEVRNRLTYLRQLGVNSIQLMPLMEFAGDYSWGYNPAHPFAVESGYGGPDALKALVKAAHEQGMAVIVDVVYNHFGPSDLDLWQLDGWSTDDKGGIYFFQDHRAETPWGETRPDYGREEVRQYIADNALMWLRDFRVDGLRWDMTPYMRSVDATGFDIPEGWDLSRAINDRIRAEFPDALSIAEDLHGEARVVSTADDGAAFHAQWDNQFVHPVRAALTATDDGQRDTNDVGRSIAYSYGDPFARVVYTESHDEVANGQARIPTEADPDDATSTHAQKMSALGAALVLTSPGIPMLFQGQEFLQDEWFRDDTPLEWSNLKEHRGIAQLYADLISLRLNRFGKSRGLTGGGVNFIHNDLSGKVLGYHRWRDGGPGDDVVVFANLSATTYRDYVIQVPFTGHWELLLNSDAQVYSSDFGDMEAYDVEGKDSSGMPYARINLAPYAVLVYARS